MESILGIIFVFGSIPAIIIATSYFRNRRIERMAMIASNTDAGHFREGETRPKHYQTMKYGMLMIGLAIGILMGTVLDANTLLHETAAYLSMVLTFGGISLVVFYVLFKNKKK